MHREAAHMQLIDDRVLHRRDKRNIFVPVVRAAHVQTAPMRTARLIVAVVVMAVDSPARAVSDRGATWVEQNELRVVAVKFVVGPIDAPAVTEDLWQVVNVDMPEIA